MLTVSTKAVTITEMNRHAKALGKLARGKPKTMSPAALDQRRNATKVRLQKRHLEHAKSVYSKTK